MIGTLRAALLAAALLLPAAVGCGYFETDEPHVAPRTPLLPPTTEALGAPTALTPTSAAPAAPAAADAAGGAAEGSPSAGGEDADTDAATGPDGGEAGDDPTGGEAGDDGATEPGDEDAGAAEPELLEIVVVRELLHSPTAFTQGLEISGGRLYESTGARDDRASTLRELSRDTGDVLRLHEITEDVFAEGLTFVDGRIYQLTWKDGVALVWDPEPEEFSEVERFSYEGQGWGLCYNGRVLVMSDGSDALHFRDPISFERVGNPVLVTLDGQELPSLNELECVGETVYANVWQTDLIVRIDPVTGRVLAVADASELGLPRPDDPNAVLNGIAWDPDSETFLITGKDWSVMYEVTFEPTGGSGDGGSPLSP